MQQLKMLNTIGLQLDSSEQKCCQGLKLTQTKNLVVQRQIIM